MPRPQTIQIFLPSGDPRGMRVAEITTRIVRVIEVPHSQLADFLMLPEAQQVASPSMAAVAVMGRTANGWLEWKAANVETLDELKRQSVNASQ